MAAVAEHPIKAFLTERARSLGFDAIGFTKATLSATERDRLNHFLAQNHHGSMGWMASRAAQRANPQTLWPEAVSLISLGLSYAPAEHPLATLSLPDRGNISVYARNRDYHDIIKGKLKHLAQALIARAGGTVKLFVDTAPVMEKPLAQQAGLGWQGKHTNLVSRTHGSWLLLGEIMTTLALPPDPPHADRCGSCTACQTACPTNAFPTPYTLDATRCIAYLTIEHPGPIPHAFRHAIGNRIYGCDDCLAVCPWNKFAATAQTQKLAARTDLIAPDLAHLATLDDAAFRTLFAGSPIKRIGRNRLARNIAIAIGNAQNPALQPAAQQLANDADPVVAEAGAWALAQGVDGKS
ncbi:MAG: tRNA epoxyqueuosine(34) reductase QueG [Acidiphilium sp.]